MATSARPNLAWLVQVEEEFGSRHIRAHVVKPQDDGDLHSLTANSWSEQAREFADLRVAAYLGEMADYGTNRSAGGRVWGVRHEYKPFVIDSADRAREIARTMDKIKRGLDKATSDLGYLADEDFGGYLGRVGMALKIQPIYVRNSTPFNPIDGNKWRKLDVPGLSYWLSEVSRLAETDSVKFAKIVRS